MKRTLIISLALLGLLACNSQPNTGQTQSYFTDNDSLTTIKGTANLDSKGRIVFEPIGAGWQRKIHLVPFDDDLKDYMFLGYDSYLYLKGKEREFWVSVEGKFITTDTLEEPQKFLFYFVALIDEKEALTDSSAALRSLNERQIFVGRAVNIQGKPAFIWEYALSEAFYLEGLEAWDDKYLDQKITVEGVLVQFIEGKSVIKDWAIIEGD